MEIISLKKKTYKLHGKKRVNKKNGYMITFVILKHKVNLINLQFSPKYFRIMTASLIFENQNSICNYLSVCFKN